MIQFVLEWNVSGSGYCEEVMPQPRSILLQTCYDIWFYRKSQWFHIRIKILKRAINQNIRKYLGSPVWRHGFWNWPRLLKVKRMDFFPTKNKTFLWSRKEVVILHTFFLYLQHDIRLSVSYISRFSPSLRCVTFGQIYCSNMNSW